MIQKIGKTLFIKESLPNIGKMPTDYELKPVYWFINTKLLVRTGVWR